MKQRGVKLAVVVAGACAVCLLTVGVALASSQCAWCDEMINSLSFYKTTYPTSNFEPYVQKVHMLQDAIGRGDQEAVRGRIGELFKMLRTRAHDINDVAADELLSYWQMVTPSEELKTSTPFMIETKPDTKTYPPDDRDLAGWDSDGS